MVTLPDNTRDLIPYLKTLYTADYLRILVASDSTRDALRYIGKLDLIDELEEFLRAEDEEAEENARTAQL